MARRAASSAIGPLVAFSELEHALKHVSRLDSKAWAAELPEKSPLFVTWTKRGHLRGCIGTFSPQPTLGGIRDYALISALKDSRFRPIQASEIPNLEVAVTLLGPLEPIEDALDWEIGVHGVQATFPGGHSATYLPEVAEEQGWTKEETLEMLAEKAGVASTRGIRMARYEGFKAHMTYAEYEALRDTPPDKQPQARPAEPE